jgi:hypothetical protein
MTVNPEVTGEGFKFGVHRSAFTVRRSPFGVHRSAFTVRRSPFTVPGVRSSEFLDPEIWTAFVELGTP